MLEISLELVEYDGLKIARESSYVGADDFCKELVVNRSQTTGRGNQRSLEVQSQSQRRLEANGHLRLRT